MTVSIEGLGPLLDLARALGLVGADGQFNTAWFGAPGKHVGRMLRDPGQREALLRAADQLLAQQSDAVVDERGRRWVQVFACKGVALHLVVTPQATAQLGVGVRLHSGDPDADLLVYVPLLDIPADADAHVVFGTASGRVVVTADVTFNAVQPLPGEAGLRGLAVGADVATDGSAPRLSLTLRGLQLPGQATPSDLGLDGEPDELGKQAVQLLMGLVQRSVADASGELAELLALVGVTDDPAVPTLPVVDIIAHGDSAWRRWLDGLMADDAAIVAWLGHVAALVRHDAAVVPAAGHGLPHRVRWTLSSGLSLAVTLLVGRAADGAPIVELGVEGRLNAAGAIDGGLEADAVLVRMTLGATPSLRGLPLLSLTGRLGPDGTVAPEDRLVNLPAPAPRFASLRAGVALGEDRRIAFALSAHDITIANHHYSVLSLTDVDALADVAGNAVADLAADILGHLGAAGTAVRVLLGLAPPPGQASWPVDLTTPLPDLLASPLRAVVAYHNRVLAEHRAGYAAVLDTLRAMLAPTGFATVPVTGIGEASCPWRLAVADGVALTAWTADGRLELAFAVDRDVVDLGGSCPTVALRLVARLVTITLDGSGAQALPGVLATLTLGACGGVPLRIGTPDAAIVAQRIGVALGWSPGAGLSVELATPGLSSIVDGLVTPFAIPRVGLGGRLVGEVPWRALELLAGHLLARLDAPWATELVDTLGWAGGSTEPRLALASLAADPVAAVHSWLVTLVREGEVAELARRIALAVGGPVVEGLPAGAYRRHGDVLAVPISATADAATRVELLLWGDAVTGAAVDDLFADRGDVAGGLAGLAARWADTDGLVGAAEAELPGAMVHDLDGVTHDALPALLAGVAGLSVGAGTIFVSGPSAPAAWADLPTVDLRAPGLVPEAFDLSRLSGEDGPWLVLLPTRADAATSPGDDGAACQAARLARVVDTVVTRIGAAAADTEVHVIAHGAAGHAAAAVAGRPGVARLVTGGTPHGGIDLDVIESQPAAGALRLLASLLPPADPDVAEDQAVTLGRGLLAPLLSAEDSLGDLTPPVTAPTVPAGVEAHAVRGRVDAERVRTALAAMVAHGMAHIEAPAAPAPTPDDRLSLGIGVTVEPPAGAGELHVTVELALTGEAFAGGPRPGLRARVGVGRVGGWLVGGPDPARPAGVSRHPSLRRADLELDLPVSGAPSACIVFHDGDALGVARTRWVVSHTEPMAEPLLPEATVLFGRLITALVADPAGAAVHGVLGALGVLEVDGLRRLLVDPRGLLANAPPARLAAALTALLTGAGGSNGAGTGEGDPAQDSTTVAVTLGGVTVEADLVARTFTFAAAAIQLDVGATLGGEVELRADRTLTGQATLALGPTALRWSPDGITLGDVALSPTPDVPGIHRLLAQLIPAQLLWAGITFLRSLPDAPLSLVDPLLRELSLLKDDRVAVPIGLFTDPARWLAEAIAESGPAGVIDALATVLGLPQPRPGAWTLPYGLELSATATALNLALVQAVADTGLRVAGGIGLTIASPPAVTAELTLALPDGAPLTSAGRVTVQIGPSGVRAALVMPASGIDLPLLPTGPGLNAIGSAAAAAAVTYALPMLLDALADRPADDPAHEVGVALRAFGDVTGLRVNGHFSHAELAQLAAQPAAELAARLSRNLSGALGALADLLAPAIPTGYTLERVGDHLIFGYAGPIVAVEVQLTVPHPASGVRVTANVRGVRPFAGALLGGSLRVEPAGLSEARVTFEVDPAIGVALGPLQLAPVAEVAITASGSHIAVGPSNTVRGVYRLTPTPAFTVEAVGEPLPAALVKLLLPLAADIALSVGAVQKLLDKQVLGGVSIREVLDGVAFSGATFDRGILNEKQLWSRLLHLAGNVAELTPTLPIKPLVLRIAPRTVSASESVYGISVSLPPGERFRLVEDDVTVDIEVDASWIAGPASAEGLVIELLRITGTTPEPFFGISVRGLGVRVGRANGPLLDTFVAADSVALHGLISVDTANGVTAGGGQLELTDFRIALGSANDSNNQVASGLLKDSASGGQKPEPRFSPALSVQSHGTDGPVMHLRAGEGDGPWWITIQRGFGPVYIEQVGFGVTRQNEKVVAARLMVDGKVTLLGLVVAVDDLALGLRWPQNASEPPLYDPRAFQIDLAGLAVAGNTGAVQIAGGLRRAPGSLPDYIGMISIRFSVYGITAYGGYAVVNDAAGRYTSLFIYGAVNAPIGGVPAFFVTGIGAGVGVNRLLLVPDDLNEFPRYPLLQALDRTSPMANPDTAMSMLQAYFPPQRGAFWFAAGLAFNSFSLVDGIAVIAVAIGDGLSIILLGLAKAGLPNPSAPLVQIELALVARFSSKDGVLWIQAQLTDNCFLLTRDCRLTGGFAYVMWFKGDKAGEFVLTMGGYHPSFHRDGYPVVPRLGFVWNVSDVLVIKGESYFALTSEAIMVGTRFEASLMAGPLWAYLRLGVDGIVYFDPFRFQVTAFAELGAGITIDIDLGIFGHIRITIGVHLHADVLLEGPEFRGRATVDLDVTSASIEFGDWVDHSTPKLAWSEFASKYIRPGGAPALTTVPGRGTMPPSTSGNHKPPTGAPGDPHLVLPEFTLTVSTTAAASRVVAAGPVAMPVPVFLAVGPMQVASVTSTLTIAVRDGTGSDHAAALAPTASTGQFPAGVWGPQPQGEPKPVPTGETIEAVHAVQLTAEATVSVGTVPIDYHQVEIGHRHQLPFLAEHAVRGDRAEDVERAIELVEDAPGEVDAVLSVAHDWLTTGARGAALSPLASATFGAGWVAPPQLAPVTLGMAADPEPKVTVGQAPAPRQRPPVDTSAHPPRVDAVLTVSAPPSTQRTTVGPAGDSIPRVNPPRLAEVRAALDPTLTASLTRIGTAAPDGETVIAADHVPVTGRAGAGTELRRRRGQAPWRTARLDELTRAAADDGFELLAGELAVLSTTNAHRDVGLVRPQMVFDGVLPVRMVTVDSAGIVISDVAAAGSVPLPRHTERIALLAGYGPLDGAAGWHAGTQLTQVGARTLIGPGCTLTSSAVLTRRAGGPVAVAQVIAADAVAGFGVVTTRLPSTVTAVAVVLETATADGADTLDLGLTGARRDGSPARLIVSGGRTIGVYGVLPDGKGAPVEVTVASGESLHLGGVLGAALGADALTESLRRHDVAGVVATGLTATTGSVQVRWLQTSKGDQVR